MHYAACPSLWEPIDQAIPPLSERTAADRLAFSNAANVFDMIRLSLAFWGYHAIRLSGDLDLCLNQSSDHSIGILSAHVAAYCRHFDVGNLVDKLQRPDG